MARVFNVTQLSTFYLQSWLPAQWDPIQFVFVCALQGRDVMRSGRLAAVNVSISDLSTVPDSLTHSLLDWRRACRRNDDVSAP